MGIWLVDVTIGVGIVGVAILRGVVGVTLGFGIVGRRRRRMFPPNVNELSWVEVDVACVGVVGVVAVVVVSVVVGMLVGVVGILVGIGIEVMTGGGFIGADMVAMDRSSRPSSGSTEIDAILLVRGPAARR